METTFKQTRIVGLAGGFINQMMGNNSSRPIVGEGATILMYSDRYAYQVTWVSDCGTRCRINRAIMKSVGKNYGDERYEYQGHSEGEGEEIVWKEKKGWCRVSNDIKYEPKFERALDERHGKYWFGSSADKYAKEMGIDNLFNPETCKLNLIEGLTKRITRYHSISIIFGFADEYNDPTF